MKYEDVIEMLRKGVSVDDICKKVQEEKEKESAIDGDRCGFDKGKVVETWTTGDGWCNDDSFRYECGGVYNHNYMDRLGFRDHDCFWECSGCKYRKK